MKNTRGLWTSIVFVAILVIASIAGFAAGSLKPTLGLDLEGGLSVILKAPDGTQATVMQQALENIRNRVDAFGVGEPEIFLSGTNIEVQLPGLAPGTIQTRSQDQYCLTSSDGSSYGCATDQATVQKAQGEIVVSPLPKTVCVVDGKGVTLDTSLCFASQTEADAAKAGITVQPKASPAPSASVSPTVSPSSSPSAGPSPAASQYCLTDANGKTFGCHPSQDKANAALKALSTKTTAFTYCLTAGAAGSIASPTPTPAPSASPAKGGKASATPSASASPSPSPTPTSYSQLSFADGSKAQLPCDFSTKQGAQTALGGLTVSHETQVFCVISSAGRNLGCYLNRQDAIDQQRATGQSHLLSVIGETARLEERVVLAIIPPTDPSYASTQLTCATVAERRSKSCSFDALTNKEVVYLGPDGQSKYRLGPIVISGGDIKKAQAVYQSASTTGSIGWQVHFDLTKSGSSAFAAATTTAVSAPSPQNQIAIVVDRQIISAPVVQGAITGGSGEISGGFTQTRAKDLATQLNAGALPVELTRQSVQTVSPTLGQQSLKQGIVAGIAGLIALFVYLLFYYRLLGVVAWLGMSIWAILALALVSLAGKSFGYSLTLAGIAGLVISLGVTADSYIVFFERLKDEVRNGKTPRSAVQPAFKRAYRTIVAADFVTGIAAIVLYLTAVSSVRGFALTLGVATVLDLFVVYFFKRPTVFLISRNERLVHLHGFGLESGVAAEPEPGELQPAPVAGGSE